MDIKDINTVSDLITQNEEDLTMDKVVKALTKDIYKEDPAVGLAVSINILRNLLTYHYDLTEIYVKDGQAEAAANWAVDTNRIDEAINLLKTIRL